MPGTWLFWLLLLLVSCSEFAELKASNFPEREEIQEFLRKHGRDNQPLFSGAPLYHVVPARRNVTVGLSTDYLNARILGPDFKQHVLDTREKEHYLKLTGYEAAPFLSFATKRFAFAFSAEYGSMASEYLNDDPSYYSYSKHESKMRFSGNGIFISFIPDLNLLSNTLTPVLLLGGRRFTAEHTVIGPTYEKGGEPIEYTYRYSAQKYHAGLSLNFRPLRKISISLWGEYTEVSYGDPDFIESSRYGSTINEDFFLEGDTFEVLLLDQKLFWERTPNTTYGLDMALLLGQLEVHLGGVLGTISNLAADSPRIIDHGLKASLSYSFKAK
jgi:hypothetical protein